MAVFAFVIKYPDDVLERRGPHREAHLAYASKLKEEGKIIAGGAFDPASEGGLILFRAESAEAVREMLEEDPYTKAGLFEESKILPWNIVIGDL